MHFQHSRHMTFGLCLFAVAAAPFTSVTVAAGFSFSKIADTDTPRPDGAGPFDINIESTHPAIDGSRLIFTTALDVRKDFASSIWSAEDNGASLQKLVDTGSLVPGGIGAFTNLSYVGAPLVKGGSVVFAGSDSNTINYNFRGGIYSVPVVGGAISRVVNYNVPIPGLNGNFQTFGDGSSGERTFSLDSGKVAFQGRDQSGEGGIFLANVDGSSPITVVATSANGFSCPNELTGNIFRLGTFIYPSLSGNRVSFYGSGVFDPSTGANKVFVAPASGGFDCSFVGSSLAPLPGDPNPIHTRYRPYTQIDGNIIVFGADDSQPFDPNFNNFRGLFAVCADGSSSLNNSDGTPTTPTCGLPKRVAATDSPFTLIVDSLSSLPGLSGLINPNSFSFSFNQGQVLFRAFDQSPSPNEGLYLAKLSDGSITKVIGSGDTLDGRQVVRFGNPGPGALSGGNLVFSALLADSIRVGGVVGVYSATQPTQPTCASDVSAKVTVARSGLRLNRTTGLYVQTLTLTNTSGSPINGPISLVLRNLSANATLVNKSGNTACLTPTGASYKAVGLSDNVLGTGGSVAVSLEFTNSTNQTILYTTQIGAGSNP